jgi:hypothetical protein
MRWDVDKSITFLTKKAKPAYAPPGECASYVRQALEEGGLIVFIPKKRYKDASGASACDYGDGLLAIGFKVVFDNTDKLVCEKIQYKPIAGDVAIYQAFEGHRHGHIQMFNGVRWVSDFLQKNMYPDHAPGLYPGPDYRKAEIPLKAYRNDSMQIANSTRMNKLPWE